MKAKKRIVIALGGNALGSNLKEQMQSVKKAVKALVDLVEEGHEILVTHGNGPQVGAINLAMDAYCKDNPGLPQVPLSVCVAMSQAYIGYDLQNALREELISRGIKKEVSTLITQVCVSKDDPAFLEPTKPIGSFLSKEEADKLIANGEKVMEDAGRGYRRVVASPKPVDIVEIESIKSLMADGQIVIAAGGGGIPVIKVGNHLKGVDAVIDKDFVAAKMAELTNADDLIILTAVEKVSINYRKENETNLDRVNLEQARKYIQEGHFAKGSMLPKVEAALSFVESAENRNARISLLEKAKDAINGKTGTVFCKY